MSMRDLFDMTGDIATAIGVIATGIGLLLTYRTLLLTNVSLRADHDWNRRQAAVGLVEEWNPRTATHRRAIERLKPGLIDVDKKTNKVVELTRAEAQEIYLSKPGGDMWSLRFHFIELLNYFEVVAAAHLHQVADRRVIEGSLRDVLCRWHTVLEHFIDVVEQNRGYQPWKPYTALVNRWASDPTSDRPATDQVAVGRGPSPSLT